MGDEPRRPGRLRNVDSVPVCGRRLSANLDGPSSKERRMTGLIVLAVIVVLVFFFISIYNGLVTSRNGYKNAFSQIDVQLTRRYDLIPNLVETAKGYMRHERETLEAVINARNAAVSANQRAAGSPGDPASMSSLNAAEGQLTGALGRLF